MTMTYNSTPALSCRMELQDDYRWPVNDITRRPTVR